MQTCTNRVVSVVIELEKLLIDEPETIEGEKIWEQVCMNRWWEIQSNE